MIINGFSLKLNILIKNAKGIAVAWIGVLIFENLNSEVV